MNNKKFIVYKHTAPNGKVYIGVTSIGVKKRWQNGKNYKTSVYFYNAINKYGWDNFIHEVLFTDLTKEEAEQKEISLIAFYKSNDHRYGYNIESGGKVAKMMPETRAKISKALKGKKKPQRRKHTEEEKKQISEKLKGRQSPMKGRHWTIEQKSNVGTPIICLETDKIYYSIGEASRETGCDKANIIRVLKGVYKQTGGMRFEYFK